MNITLALPKRKVIPLIIKGLENPGVHIKVWNQNYRELEEIAEEIEQIYREPESKFKITDEEFFKRMVRFSFTIYEEDLCNSDIIIESTDFEFEKRKMILSAFEKNLKRNNSVIVSTISFENFILMKNYLNQSKRFLVVESKCQNYKEYFDINLKSIYQNYSLFMFKTAGDYLGFQMNFEFDYNIVEKQMILKIIKDGICEMIQSSLSPIAIDSLFNQIFETKMGPFILADYIGIDSVLEYIINEGDSIFLSNSLNVQILQNMIKSGHLGMKTRKGFYEY